MNKVYKLAKEFGDAIEDAKANGKFEKDTRFR